jgi:hexokinase
VSARGRATPAAWTRARPPDASCERVGCTTGTSSWSATAAFLAEMARGLSGAASSLLMVPTFIEADREVRRREPVVAIDAGGTHLRVALVEVGSDGAPRVSAFRRHPMPGLDREVSSRAFFAVLADRGAGRQRGVGRLRRVQPRCHRPRYDAKSADPGRYVSFKPRVTAFVDAALPDRLRPELVAVGHAALVGAAICALTN